MTAINKSNWLMFKNFIHNELGISREEISSWIKDEVAKQTEKFCQEKLQDENFIRKIISSQLNGYSFQNNRLKRDIIENIEHTVKQTIMKQIEIDFLPEITKENSDDILKCM